MNTLNPTVLARHLKRHAGSLAALLLCGASVPVVAQTVAAVADEQGFTLLPHVSTPIVLKSTPDAACDLHAVGITDKARTLRFYANADGYLKIHANPQQESDEGIRMQLDCQEAGGIARYPLHFRASSTPTSQMPAPLSVMPAPTGSQIRPALSASAAAELSDEELASKGYPIRPDAAKAPAKYALWLDRVSRPMTLVPSHVVSRSDIRHRTPEVEAGVSDNLNWSGFVADQTKRSYSAVDGNWNVPELIGAEANHSTYSSLWVGLDGYGLSDLEQAGTEQDALQEGSVYFANYYAWTEVLPGEPEQPTGLSPNPGDRMSVEVWISTGGGAPNANGQYAAFRIVDDTQNQGTGSIYAPLTSYYNGSTAEWIMERPCLNVSGSTCTQYAELSDYNYAQMLGAGALTLGGPWPDYSAIENRELWLYNEHINGSDNNLLSEGMADIYENKAEDIYFQFLNFH